MKKKIEFLNRLFALLNCRLELLEWLREERVMTDDEIQHLLTEHHSSHASRIAVLLEDFQKKETLQLVDYTWSILPKELLKLSIVAPNAKKEFTYSV